jgi:6-phosphogluconolactonase (cycloisomerase 2 family)
VDYKIKGVTLTLAVLSGALLVTGCTSSAPDKSLNNTYVQSTVADAAQSLTKDFVSPGRGAPSVYSNPYLDSLLYGGTGGVVPDIFDGNETQSGTAGAVVAYDVDQSVDDNNNPNPTGNFVTNTTDTSLVAAAGSNTQSGFVPGLNWVALSNTSSAVNDQFCYIISRTDAFPALANASIGTPPIDTVLPSLVIFDVTNGVTLVNGSSVVMNVTTQAIATVNGSTGPVNVTAGNIITGSTTSTNATTNTTMTTPTLASLQSVPYNLTSVVTGVATPPNGGTPVSFTGVAFSTAQAQLATVGSTSFGTAETTGNTSAYVATETVTSTISVLDPIAEGVSFPDAQVNASTGLLYTPYPTYGVVEGEAQYTGTNESIVNGSTPIETYSWTGQPGLTAQEIQDNGGNFSSVPFPLSIGSFGQTTQPYAIYVSPNGNFAYVTINEQFTSDAGGTEGEDLASAADFVFTGGSSLGSQNITISAAPTKQSFRRGLIYTFALDTTTGAYLYVGATPSPTNSSDCREIAFSPNAGKLYATCFEANTVTDAAGGVYGTSNGTLAEYNINPVNGTLTLANSFVTGPGTEGIYVDRGGGQVYISDHLTNAGNLSANNFAYEASGETTPALVMPPRNGLPYQLPATSAGLIQLPVGSLEVFPINTDGSLAARSQIVYGSTNPNIAEGAYSGITTISPDVTGISFPTDVVESPVFNSIYALHKEAPDAKVRSVVATDSAGQPYRVILAGLLDNVAPGTTYGEIQTFAFNSTTQGLVPQALSSAISIAGFVAGERNADHLTVDPDGRFLYATFRADPPVYSNATTTARAMGTFTGAITDYSAGAPGHFATSLAQSDGIARLLSSQPLASGATDPVMGTFFQITRQ